MSITVAKTRFMYGTPDGLIHADCDRCDWRKVYRSYRAALRYADDHHAKHYHEDLTARLGK